MCFCLRASYPAELKRIKNLHYEKGVSDCKHKSAMYHNHLKSKGIESKVVAGAIKEHKTQNMLGLKFTGGVGI